MKIVIVLYIIGIITFWLGVFNLASTAKRNWNAVDENLKANAKKRSNASCNLTLIVGSLLPMVNFLVGFLYISNPLYFLKK